MKNKILDINVVKNYYNLIFTDQLLISMQKEIKIEDLIISYNYYANFLNSNYFIDNIEIESDYLKSDDEVKKNSEYLLKKYKKRYKLEVEDINENFNFFDSSISEEDFEKGLENVFQYLNNIIINCYKDYNETDINKKVDINEILKKINIIEENGHFKIFNLILDKNKIIEIILIMISFIIRNIFTLSSGRKIIFTNENIMNILLKGLYIQNIYLQIFILRNLKKYIMEDKEECNEIHLKMIKICLFSKSLCSFNRSNELIQFLLKENKYIPKIFNYYFLNKLKRSLETYDNIQRLRLLDLIVDAISLNKTEIYEIFQIKSKEEKEKDTIDFNNLNNIKDLDNDIKNTFFDSDFEDSYTFDDISYMDKKHITHIMDKYKINLNEIIKKTKINVYKYFHKIYLKDDILLKINVLEIFSKIVKNISHDKHISKYNMQFLYLVLNDLNNPDEEILHTSILNALISYINIHTSLLNYIINAHSNIILKKTIEYLNDNTDIDKIIIGLKGFGYFFSIKQSADIILQLDENSYLTCIEKINTHESTNILRHAINIWQIIIESKTMSEEWIKKIIHNNIFKKVITVLKEIDDSIVEINCFKLLNTMINYDICNLILNEQWLINSLVNTSENYTYQLKKSKYDFFAAFYKHYEKFIINNTYSYNVIKNYLQTIPSLY